MITIHGDNERRETASLVPYARNARTHSDAQIDQICDSMRQWGFTMPVLVDETGGIIAGHGRVMAATRLALPEVPVIVARGWNDAQRRAYVIADNKLALNSGWDDAMLLSEMEAIDALGFDMQLAGFDAEEMLNLLIRDHEAQDQPSKEGKTGDDDAPEVAETPPISRPGDVWICGHHRVMCGDSTSLEAAERLMGGDRADFCFTSPPYNAAIKASGMMMQNAANKVKGHLSTLYGDGYTDDLSSADYVAFNRAIFTVMAAIAAERFACCYNINYNKNSPSEYLDVAVAGREFFPLVETIAWEKTMAISLKGNNLTRIYEFIFVYAKGELVMNKELNGCERNLWKISNVGANHEIHKACFPVALAEKGVALFAPPGGFVFEPFGGSGTTMIACEKTGRHARLMELDPRYVDVIVARWEAFTELEARLETTGQTWAEVNAERAEPVAAAA